MSDHPDALTKAELIAAIHLERGRLEETLARLTHTQMLLPGVDGEWSVKDALAHISTWERWMIAWTESLLRGEKPATPEPWDVDTMNAETYARVKDLTLGEVLDESRQSGWDALALAESLSEVQLQTVFADTWPMGPLWLGIAANTNLHYKDHYTDIQKWLESQRKER
jgi:hypothetical protein